MALRLGDQGWTVREQIIEDGVSGLTIQFKVMPDGSPRLMIFGDILPFGNREIIFNDHGEEAGAGTATTSPCHADWIEEVP